MKQLNAHLSFFLALMKGIQGVNLKHCHRASYLKFMLKSLKRKAFSCLAASMKGFVEKKLMFYKQCYFIFVIFFTQPQFEAWKFYT